MYDVITFGSASRDVFVRAPALDVHPSDHTPSGLECCFPMGAKLEISELVVETGGGGTNAAATFARLGFKTAVVTSLGDDEGKGDVLAMLKNENIRTELIQSHPGLKTAFAVIILAGSGERTILIHRGAAEKFDGEKIPWRKLKAQWFYISSLGGDLDLLAKILAHAAAKGAKVAWNPGGKELAAGQEKLFPLIRQVDVFNLNVEEAMKLTGLTERDPKKLALAVGTLPRRTAIVTDGASGAYAADHGKVWHCGVIDVPIVNRTGAGDAFGSGLVAGLMKQDDLAYALKVGTWNGTGVVQQTGAKKGLLRAYPDPVALSQVPLKEI